MLHVRAIFRGVFFLTITLTASGSLAWGQCSGSTTTQTCTFTGLSVTAATNAKATTYPLQATPATLAGPVTNVSVSLTGITQSSPSNIGGAELLLVAPNGTQLVIYALDGNAFSAPPSSLTVDDVGGDQCSLTNPNAQLVGAAHVKSIVCSSNHQLPPGPSGSTSFPDGFPNVVAPGTSCTHAVCAGANPPSVTMNNTFSSVANANGTWSLYLINNGNSGSAGDDIHITGWSLTLTTAGGSVAATTTAVSPANTSVTRTPPNPSNPATITATVSSTSTVNGGTVSFSDNGSPVVCGGGSNTTVANGTATCIVTFTQEGIHPITASYAGVSGTFAPSNSPANTPANVTVTNNTTSSNVTANGGTFCNVGNLAIPATGSNFGVSAPYPSQVFVGVNGSPNIPGVITNLTVDLKQIHHQQSDSPSLLLVSPAGTAYILMALAYSSTGGGPVDMTLSDAGATQLPAGAGLSLTAGTFRPADYNQSANQDQGVFPAPAPQSGFLFPTPLGASQPAGPSTIGQAFNGAGATGTWQLFVLNNAGGSGGITNGWCLNFSVNPNLHSTTTTVTPSPALSYTTAPFTSKFPPVPANDFVTLTATTTSDITVNAGSVTFTDNGVNLTCGFSTTNPATVSSGVAICKTTFAAEGNHNIRATFHDAGTTFGDSHGNTLERTDSHSTRTPIGPVNYEYCNPGKITIPALAPGNVAAAPGNPYPSNIFINDLPGTINKVTLSIPDFTVQAVAIRDLTSLLVGPNQNSADSLDLFSHVGTNAGAFANAAYTLDDAAASGANQGINPASGTYKPTSFGTPLYPSLSPVGPYPPPGAPQYAAPSGTSTFAGVYGSGIGNTRVGAGTWSLFQQSTVNGTTIFEGNGTNQPGWCLNFTVNPPDLSISTLTHSPASFKRGSPGTITTTVHNAGPGPSGGLVTVVDTLPAGMSGSDFTAAAAAGWTCSGTTTVTCTSPAAIAAGSNSTFSFDVSVGVVTADSVTNTSVVSGGGDNSPGNNNASDGPFGVHGTILTINKTHTDPFTQGQVGATYSITVHNSGASGADSGPGATVGTIQVTDALPNNFTLTAVGGTGWTCQPPASGVSCTLNAPLAVGSTTNPITVTVTVSNSMLGPVTNTAILTATTDQIGPAGNNQHNDPTNITQVPSQMAANAGTTPQSAAVNTAFANALAVTVLDAGNHPVANVSVTFTAPGSPASGTFALVAGCTASSCVVNTNSSGVATASTFTANGTIGSYSVHTTSGALTPVDFALSNTDTPATVTSLNSTTANGSYGAGVLIPITVTFNKAVNVTGTPTLTLNDGAVVNYTSGSGTATLTFNYTVAAGQNTPKLDANSTSALALNGGTIKNPSTLDAILTPPVSPTAGALGVNKSIVIDTIAPTVTNVTSTTADGTYGVGATVAITVTFSESVNVTGTPTLALNSGGSASYSSGTGTSTLTFTYTVAAGQNSAHLDYTSTSALALSGGTIKDAAQNAANLTLAAPGAAGSLGANKNIVIDTTGAIVTNVTSTTGNGTYGVGASVAITVTFSKTVNVTGTPQLALNSGGTASYSSGTGTTTLTFSYTVAAGQNSAHLDYTSTSALTLNGGTIKDAALNAATLTLPAPGAAGSLGANTNIVIDTTGATVTNVTSTTANGTYGAGASVAVTVTFSKTVNVTGTPQLALNSGGTASYSSGTGTGTLTFTYTVAAGQNSAHLDYTSTSALTLNGGTIKDAALNAATLTLPAPGAAGSLGANKNIVIDTTAPTVTNITSTTANGTYGVGANIAVTVTFSKAVNVTGTPQLALNSGGTASYSSGTGTTTLTFSYTVAAGQNSPHLDYTSTSALTLNGGTIKDAALNAATLTLPAPGAAGSLGFNTNIVINTAAAATTTTAANASANFSASDQLVTLSALVTSSGPVNSGTVTFTVLQGVTVIGVPVTSATVAGGAANATYTLPGGTAAAVYTIQAVYNPGVGFTGSSDSTHTLTVNSAAAATTTTAANASANFSASSQLVTLSALVTSSSQVNSGTVTFTVLQGVTVIGIPVTSPTVAAGAASANFTLPGGTAAAVYTIQAVYNPGAGFAGSSDSTHTLTVNGSGGPTVVSYSVLFGNQSYNVIGSTRVRLPWQVTGIRVTFSTVIASGDMNSLTGVTTTGFSGLGTNTLTWTISPVALGNLSTNLSGSGADALKDASNNPLGGGAGFAQALKILWGDFSDDGFVTSGDLVLVNQARSLPYNIFADMNGDGVIDANDLNIVRSRNGTSLP